MLRPTAPYEDDGMNRHQLELPLGCSMGTYHAVQLTLHRADLAPLAIGLSGSYDAHTWNSWGERGDATYSANPTAYVPNLHGDHLDWLPRSGVHPAHRRPR